jgi:type II secretion system protein J
MSALDDHHGFTLIEVLIAIAIFALLMIAVYQTFDQSVRSYQTVERSRDLNETARLILDRIQDDLQSAVIFTDNPDMVLVGEDGTGPGGQPTDRLVFATLNHLPLDPNAPESDLAEVEYQIRPDPETRAPLLVRREKAYLDDDHEKGGVVTVLSDKVQGLNFRYFDGTEALKEAWDGRALGDQVAHDQGQELSRTVNTGVLPQAVETTLVIRDADGRDVAFTSVTRLALAKPPPVVDGSLVQ